MYKDWSYLWVWAPVCGPTCSVTALPPHRLHHVHQDQRLGRDPGQPEHPQHVGEPDPLPRVLEQQLKSVDPVHVPHQQVDVPTRVVEPLQPHGEAHRRVEGQRQAREHGHQLPHVRRQLDHQPPQRNHDVQHHQRGKHRLEVEQEHVAHAEHELDGRHAQPQRGAVPGQQPEPQRRLVVGAVEVYVGGGVVVDEHRRHAEENRTEQRVELEQGFLGQQQHHAGDEDTWDTTDRHTIDVTIQKTTQ